MATRDRTTLFIQYRNSYSSPLKQAGKCVAMADIIPLWDINILLAKLGRSRAGIANGVSGSGMSGRITTGSAGALADEDSRGLLQAGGQGDAYTMIEMSQLPPRW